MKKTLLSISETIVFNLVVAYFFFYIQSNQGMYLELNPHPILFIGIFIALRYGNYLGVINAMISSMFYITIFYLVEGEFRLGITDIIYDYKYVYITLITTSVIGIYIGNIKGKLLKAVDDYKVILHKYNLLKANYDKSLKVVSNMEAQIVNSDESILGLYEVISKLNSLNVDDLYYEIVGIIKKYIHATSIRIYTIDLDNKYLRLMAKEGTNTDDLPFSIPFKSAVGINELLNEDRVLKWNEIKDDNPPIFLAPLKKDDKTYGVIYIYDMEFDKYSEYALQTLKLITNWLNESLSQAEYVSSIIEDKHIVGTNNILKMDYFKKKILAEERKRDFEINYKVFIYKVIDMDIRVVDQIINSLIKSSDSVGFNPKSKLLYILLSGLEEEHINLVEQRIDTAFKNALQKV